MKVIVCYDRRAHDVDERGYGRSKFVNDFLIFGRRTKWVESMLKVSYVIVLTSDSLFTNNRFNMTTGPKHWELLMRARANDCQSYVLCASPARATAEMIKEDPDGYVAFGHSLAVNP